MSAAPKTFDAHLHIIDAAHPLVENNGYLPDEVTVARGGSADLDDLELLARRARRPFRDDDLDLIAQAVGPEHRDDVFWNHAAAFYLER